jgi:hypothetical protein
MRALIVKYQGTCKKCGKTLDIGEQAMYEKSMGIFCIGCEPKEIEEIRAFRLAKAEAKAERYKEWAEKREQKAMAQLNSNPEIRHDWAFITQPGYIPTRARMIQADNKAHESLHIAKEMRNKAENLLNVRVAGDAERNREAKRQANDALITKGSKVYDPVFGEGIVLSIHKKSYRIQFNYKSNDGQSFVYARDKSYIKPL